MHCICRHFNFVTFNEPSTRYQSPNEEDDVVDSDFSIDEDDDVRSDLEDEEEGGRKRPKRGAGVVTKAYREPPKKTPAEKAKEKRDREAR